MLAKLLVLCPRASFYTERCSNPSYSNTLLTTLNARSFLRQDHVDVGPMPLLWNDTSVSIPEWHVQSRRTTAIHTAQTVDPLVHSEFDMAVLKVGGLSFNQGL